MPDPTFRLQFASVLPKKARIVLCKPAQIRSGWPGQVWGKRIWSGGKPVCKKSSGPFLEERNRPATSFPTFRLGFVLPHTARITLCKTSLVPILSWLTVSGFGQTDSVRKQAGVQELSGPLLANASEPNRMGSGMFTGYYTYR